LAAGPAPQIAAKASSAQDRSEHATERIKMRERARGGSNAAMGRLGVRDVVRDPAVKI
jgi:hypothetical protein